MREEIKKISNGSGMLQFSASWCGPCKVLTKTINDNEDKLTNVKRLCVDLDSYQDIGAEFGIRSIPTLILFKDGKEVKRTVGSKTIEQLLEFIGE